MLIFEKNSKNFTALLEKEQKRIDEITAGWDDPTSANWGHDDSAEIAEIHATPDGTTTTQNIYKCTALYSYTVKKHNFSK